VAPVKVETSGIEPDRREGTGLQPAEDTLSSTVSVAGEGLEPPTFWL
jgi:hypothetical protein